MQHKNGILAIAILIGVFSCTHREDDGIQKVKFQAVQADGPSTKTVLQADGSVFWSPGDAVSLFYGGATIQKTKLTAENTSAAAQTVFSGVLDGFLPDGSTAFWAVYPYAAETAFDGSAVTVTVPAEQTAVAGTFASDAFVSIATSKDYTLQFYNLCGGVKFSVANQGITSVIFKGNNDEILAGQVQATFDENGRPVVTEVVKGSMELVLNAPEGGFEVGKWYYLVALPTTLSTGYTMTFLDATGEVVAERVTDTSIAIKRAVWGKLTEADNEDEHISASKYLTFTSEGTTKLSLTNIRNNFPVLYYSIDANNWTLWDYGDLTFSANAPLFICGDNPDGFSNSIYNYSQFVTSGDVFSVSGDIMSLLDMETDLTVIPSISCFYSLFKGCQNMVTGPSLPATTLMDYCYSEMFFGCQLTTAPELPATNLASSCYSQMFYGCDKMTTAPVLPATTLAEDCYGAMFEDCTSLTTAPELPATTLAYDCYVGMFRGCTSLTTAPELPATTLADNCYCQMFSGCTSLNTAPELPATTLTAHCYNGMFDGCTNLITAPELPATTLAFMCYTNMLRDCTSLILAPELPATTLAEECYDEMFSGCTSLTTAPALPATTLTRYCYYEMFFGCTSLTVAPDLPAATLSDYCYDSMFSGCSSLNKITCLATDINANSCTNNWLSGVAETGTFVKAPDVAWPSGASGIPEGWEIEVEQSMTASKYLTFTSQGTTKLTLYNNGANAPVLYYSTDAQNWTRWDYSELTFTTNNPLYICGDNNQGFSSSDYEYSRFTATGDSFAVSGDVMSLLDRFDDMSTIPNEMCFTRLFMNCTGLTSGPSLPATKLSNSCYSFMFYSCSGLSVAPELPAISLEYGCYEYMFCNCTSLSVAPELPALTLAEYCYDNMFVGCTNLTSAPSLPATTLANGCYQQMFYSCNHLTTAPVLPAPTLVELCYSGMFYECAALNHVECLATDISATYCTDGWLAHVSSTGTFVKAPNAQWPRSASGIPEGWTVQNASEPDMDGRWEALRNNDDPTSVAFVALFEGSNLDLYIIAWGQHYVGTYQYADGAIVYTISEAYQAYTDDTATSHSWEAGNLDASTLTLSDGYDWYQMDPDTLANYKEDLQEFSFLLQDGNNSATSALFGLDIVFTKVN